MTKILSLFGGCEIGCQAVKDAGIPITEYHSFEIDKYAIEIAQKNHPEIIHHGEITENTDFTQFKDFDLLIGGSPCQGFSYVGKGLAFDDPRSALFFEFVRAKKEINPKHFMLENVKMKKEYLDIISEHLNTNPIQINSALVSAQNRVRNYWCNWEVEQPEDKEIFTKDIADHSNMNINSKGWQEWWQKNQDFQLKKKYSCYMNMQDKAITMTARQVSSWNGNLVKHRRGIRFLSVIEAERLQTLPDNYTEGVSNAQRYKMLGNGFNKATIQHILESM